MKRNEMFKVMLDSYVKEVPQMEDGGTELSIRLLRMLDDMIAVGIVFPSDTNRAFTWENEDE